MLEVPASFLESPTLARVARAHQRNCDDKGASIRLSKNNFSPPLLKDRHSTDGSIKSSSTDAFTVKKGPLWQQRERIFARWKERYFVLTKDYLHCFRRAPGNKITEMGEFIFKVKLADLEAIEWQNRKSCSVIALRMPREGRLLLRGREGLEDWFELLEDCMINSRERKRAIRLGLDPRTLSLARPEQMGFDRDSDWPFRCRTSFPGLRPGALADSVPDLPRLFPDAWPPDLPQRLLRHQQRLSLLTDLGDLPASEFDTPPPSVPASVRGRRRRLGEFLLSSPGPTPSVTPSASFRSCIFLPPGNDSFRFSVQGGNMAPFLQRSRERSLSDARATQRSRGEVRRQSSYVTAVSPGVTQV